MKAALDDAEPLMRTEGRRLLAQTKPAEALPLLEKAVDSGEIARAAGGLRRAGRPEGAGRGRSAGEADGQTARTSKLPPEVTLDLLEAAGKRSAGT